MKKKGFLLLALCFLLISNKNIFAENKILTEETQDSNYVYDYFYNGKMENIIKPPEKTVQYKNKLLKVELVLVNEKEATIVYSLKSLEGKNEELDLFNGTGVQLSNYTCNKSSGGSNGKLDTETKKFVTEEYVFNKEPGIEKLFFSENYKDYIEIDFSKSVDFKNIRVKHKLPNLGTNIKNIYISQTYFRLDFDQPRMGRSNEMPTRVFIKMKDGSIKTNNELKNQKLILADLNFYFKEPINLNDVVSVIIEDTEYPLDGSASQKIKLDKSLLPIEVKSYSYDDNIYCSVKEVFDKLGGTYQFDKTLNKLKINYRDDSFEFILGDYKALYNGKEIILDNYEIDGIKLMDEDLLSNSNLFTNNFGLDVRLKNFNRDLSDNLFYVIP